MWSLKGTFHKASCSVCSHFTRMSIPGKVYSLLFTVDLRCLRLYRILSDSSELVQFLGFSLIYSCESKQISNTVSPESQLFNLSPNLPFKKKTLMATPPQVKEQQSVDGSTGPAGPHFLVPSPEQCWSLCCMAAIGPPSPTCVAHPGTDTRAHLRVPCCIKKPNTAIESFIDYSLFPAFQGLSTRNFKQI